MKYVLKFTLQLIAFIFIYLLWLLPYRIWNAAKHEDHNEIVYDFGYCYRMLKWNLFKRHNIL